MIIMFIFTDYFESRRISVFKLQVALQIHVIQMNRTCTAQTVRSNYW